MSGIEEVDLRLAAARIARLQAITAALAESLTPSQVADVVVGQGIAALGARAGSVALLSSDGSTLELLAAIGYPAELLDTYRAFPITEAVPLADCVRTGEIVLIDSPDARARSYPNLVSSPPDHQAWAAVPLVVDGRVIGAMGLSFAEMHPFDAAERDFILALARQCAQALDRARLYEAEHRTRAAAEAAQSRLAFLAEASTTLASSLDYQTTLANVARLATPVLADWCLIDVVDSDGAIRRVAAAHADPARHKLVQRLLRYPPDGNQHSPVVRAMRERKPIMAGEVPDALPATPAQGQEHLRILRALAPTTFLIVPLLARDHVLGALTLVVAESGWLYGPADIALAEELARRAAAAIENARLYSETRAAVRARDELLSIVSHDLQTPLQVIKSQAELLARRLARDGELDPEQMRDGLMRIDSETAKMAQLIGELLDLARLQVGQAPNLDRQPADLVMLARQVVAASQQMTERHQIRIECDATELVGQWDRVRLERLLDNLIANAIKYSPDGGEILVEIAHQADPGGDWAVLAVRDPGIGIPAADLPRIFERFKRAGNVAGKFGGTGIGLASARQIVEQHGGSITAASEEGRGSTFTVRLPLAEMQNAE